jgi:hypothetical protein
MHLRFMLFFLSLTCSIVAFSGAEVEPNNTPSEATTLTSGVTMSGNLYDDTDEDYFRINVGSSGTLSIGISSFNVAAVQVLNPSLQVVSGLDYVSGTQSLSVGVATSGYYYIRIFEGSLEADTDSYDLTVTADAISVACPGQSYELKTQSDVDAFGALQCNSIAGDLWVGMYQSPPSDINDLRPLSSVNSVGGGI